jgi:hypothetical protein
MRLGTKELIPAVAWLVCGGIAHAQDGMPGPGLCYVTDKPYTAVIEVESVQTLESGGHLSRDDHFQKVYRDSAGRTRVESYSRATQGGDDYGVLMFVSVHDPLAEMTYELNPQDHTAKQYYDDRGAWPQENPCPVGPGPRLILQTSWTTTSEPKSAFIDGRSTGARRRISFEDLGIQQMEGLEVSGTRKTVTYLPDATESNPQFDVVTEQWTSTDLRIPVLTTTNDPRVGESSNRTTNIERSEPDPALFQVPDDYTIKKDAAEAQQ